MSLNIHMAEISSRAEKLNALTAALDRELKERQAALAAAWEAELGRFIKAAKQPVNLNDTDKLVADYITAHPGSFGQKIAYECGITSEHVRRIFSQKLKKLGFRNLRGRGYFPPEFV